MRRRVPPGLLFVAGASLVLASSAYHDPASNVQVSSSSMHEAALPTPVLLKEATPPNAYEQRKGLTPQSSLGAESVTVHSDVFMEDIDGENEKFTPVPMIVLQRGQTYRVEQRYRNNNYATLHTGFSKWEPTAGHPTGFWVFQNNDILGWSERSGDNQGEGVLKADDYPSGKCLISFWSHSEAVATDEEGSRYRYVPFTTWKQSRPSRQGRNTTVFTFEFRDKYTTATVTLYRLPKSSK